MSNGERTFGRLFGVGVGPGDPDLITLKALKILRSACVLAIPRPSKYAESVAWRCAAPHLGEAVTLPSGQAQERLFLTFPMTKDPEVLVPAWQAAAAALVERLSAGKDVAFLTQGDPMVYSTFIYLSEEMRTRLPDLEVVIVPGVSSISAGPAAAGIPLADGEERVAVLPATYGVEDLRRILRDFDSIVLMKVASKIPEVIAALEAEGLLDSATYIERASSANQRVIRDLRSLVNDRCVYFSMIFVHKKTRSGVLRHGAAAPRPLAPEVAHVGP